jgi:LmbE family N-acetylglucosaminyl deacetylase
VLGVDDRQVTCLGYPETRLETRRKEAAERVADLLVRMNCNRVIVPSEFEPDIWSTDHRATTEIVFEALRRVNRRCEVVEYLVWFWYHWPWVPIFGTDDARQIFSLSVRNVFGIKTWQAVNASVTVDTLRSRKFKALSEYRTQMTRIRTDCAWPILSDVAQGEFLQAFLGSREWLKTTFWEADSDAAGSA